MNIISKLMTYLLIIGFAVSALAQMPEMNQDKYQSKNYPDLSLLSSNIKQLCKELNICNATRVLDLVRLSRYKYKLLTDEKKSGVDFILSKTMNDHWSILVDQKHWFVHYSGQHLLTDLIEEAEHMAREGHCHAAETKIEKVLKFKPNMDWAYFIKAHCKLQQGLFQEFIQNTEKAIKLNNTETLYYNQLAWFHATTKFSKYRDARKGLQYALKAVSMSPNNWKVTDTLAASYARNGQYHLALETQEKAMNLLRKDNEIAADQIYENLKKMNTRKRLYQHRRAYTEIN